MESTNKLLTTKQAADLIGYSYRTLEYWRAIKKDDLKWRVLPNTRAIRYHIDDVEAFIKSARRVDECEAKK